MAVLTELDLAARMTKPYVDVGLLAASWPDGTVTFGTCSVVGRNDILTALHCIYNPDKGGLASGLKFYFGADYNETTGLFESIVYTPAFSKIAVAALVDRVFVDADHSTMTKAEAAYDVALIGIDAPLGDTLGWLSLASEYTGSQTGSSVGYPVGSTGMMMETVNVVRDSAWGIFNSATETMGAGSSGGPLLINGMVAGVKSTDLWWSDVGIAFLHSTLLANIAKNDYLIAGNGNTGQTLVGTSANETFSSGDANDSMDGGAGIDTAQFSGNRANYTLSKGINSSWTVQSLAQGTDTLINMERLQFADKKLALDLQPTEHAGQALEFIGLMAPDLISSASTVGMIVKIFDQGSSLHDVCQLAIDVGLVTAFAGSSSNASLAAMAYQNVVGEPANAASVETLLGYMDGRYASYTQADFMSVVAALELNQTHINLVGLQQTGVEYV
jgi:V8-like Glu-specific endopeptidase